MKYRVPNAEERKLWDAYRLGCSRHNLPDPGMIPLEWPDDEAMASKLTHILINAPVTQEGLKSAANQVLDMRVRRGVQKLKASAVGQQPTLPAAPAGKAKCDRCLGEGLVLCPRCDGRGTLTGPYPPYEAVTNPVMQTVRCTKCRAVGKVVCIVCGGNRA